MKALLPLALLGAAATIGAAIYLIEGGLRRLLGRDEHAPRPPAPPPAKPYDHSSDEVLTRALWRDQVLIDIRGLPTAKATEVWPGGMPPWMLEEWR